MNGSGTHRQVSGRVRVLHTAFVIALVAAVGAGLFATGTTRAQTATVLSTSSVTPADVAFYAEVSLDTSSPQVQQLDALLGRMGADESLIDLITESASEEGLNIDLTGAEIAVAVLPTALAAGESVTNDIFDSAIGAGSPSEIGTGASAEPGGVVVVVRPTNIAALESATRESEGVPTGTEQYLGTDVLTYARNDTVYAFDGDFMIAGSTVAEIKMFIDTARGTSGSLADLEQFGQASDLLPADRVAYAFSNGQVLQDAIEQAFEQPEWYAQIEESLDSLITYSGATVSAAEAGLRFDSVSIPVNVGDEFSANGVAANLDGASRMPIDTVIFAEGFELGQSTLMNALGIGLVAAFITASSSSSDEEASPTPVSVDDLYDQMAQLIGFNLKTDFIDQLTGPYAFGVWNVDAEMPTVALVSGADDLVKLGDTLGTISLLIQAGGQGQTNVTSLVVEGGSLDHVEFEDGGTTYEIDYGVANGEFVLSLGGGAETVVNGPAESLADSTRYTTALSYLPSEYQAVYYVDLVRAEDAGEDAAGALIGEDGPLANMLAIPEAGGSPAESLAAVSYVEDGYAFTSGIVVVP